MVFDRRGHFVDGLKPEQFALTLNGEAKPISFSIGWVQHPGAKLFDRP